MTSTWIISIPKQTPDITNWGKMVMWPVHWIFILCWSDPINFIVIWLLIFLWKNFSHKTSKVPWDLRSSEWSAFVNNNIHCLWFRLYARPHFFKVDLLAPLSIYWLHKFISKFKLPIDWSWVGINKRADWQTFLHLLYWSNWNNMYKAFWDGWHDYCLSQFASMQ